MFPEDGLRKDMTCRYVREYQKPAKIGDCILEPSKICLPKRVDRRSETAETMMTDYDSGIFGRGKYSRIIPCISRMIHSFLSHSRSSGTRPPSPLRAEPEVSGKIRPHWRLDSRLLEPWAQPMFLEVSAGVRRRFSTKSSGIA